MPGEKFADCDCTAADEEWELTGQLAYLDGDEGTEMVEYECQTCGERADVSVPFARV